MAGQPGPRPLRSQEGQEGQEGQGGKICHSWRNEWTTGRGFRWYGPLRLKKAGTEYPEASSQKRSLLSEQSYREWEVVTPGDTPDFNIEPDGGMTPPAEFTYHGHQVEIVPPDTAHLIGNYWQIKIDGVIRGNFLFSSARMAADEAKKLIDTGLFP